MSNFELISSTKYNGTVPIHKYKSSTTGLTVILSEVEGPAVKGSIIVVTETTDDDGLPHALEHLLFFGSKSYPYKGILDLISNRCLASNTNAKSETDYTAFMIETGGSEGFLKILPIYIDHILYPTLTDSAFLTEIYHVTGSGENSGILYCESEGRQNIAEYNAKLELMPLLYPNSAYCACIKGCTENLKTSTSNEKVKEFHSKFYRPENICIIITGTIDPEEVFKSLEPIEEAFAAEEPLEPFECPWETPVEPLTESMTKKLMFPSDEEEFGMVYIGWRGPNSKNEIQELKACFILLQYLCDTSISPLQRYLIETKDSFAGNINYQILENSESGIIVDISNVPVSKIDTIFDKIQEILEKILDETEPLDMERMNNVIENEIIRFRSILENQVHKNIALGVLGDTKFGGAEEDFEIRMNPVDQLENLKSVEKEFWLNLLKQYFIESKYVEVRAFPSIEETDRLVGLKLRYQDKNRLELDEAGLLEKEEQLQQAIELNETETPFELLLSYEIPGTDDIKFHEGKVYRLNGEENPPGLELETLPVYAEFFDTSTNFVFIKAIINTTDLSPPQRYFLPLLFELIMKSPIESEDESLAYEEVVAGLQSDTVSSIINLGIDCATRFNCGPYSQLASLMLQLEPEKYNNGVEWLIKLLYYTKFDKDRIEIIARQMINDVSYTKRRAQKIARDLLNSMYYQSESNVAKNFMTKQSNFLYEILSDFDDPERSENIIQNLNEIREILIKPKNLAIQIVANYEKLSELEINLNEPWLKMNCDEELNKSLTVIPDWNFVKNVEESENFRGIVYGMAECDQTLFIQGIQSINDYMSSELPALLLFLQYFGQREGPLWREVRGHGYANDFAFVPHPNEGLLLLHINRATNICAAYKNIKTIIENHLQEEAPFDEVFLESAKCSLIFQFIQRENTINAFISELFLSSFKNVPISYNQDIVNVVRDITEEELYAVGKKYVAPLFSDAAKTSIVCHSNNVLKILNSFAEIGRVFSRDLLLEYYLEQD